MKNALNQFLTPERKLIISFVSETLLWIVLLLFPIFALAFGQRPGAPSPYVMTTCSFFVYALILAHHGYRNRYNLILSLNDYISSGLFIIAAIVLLVLGANSGTLVALMAFFYALFILRRIPRLVVYHKPRHILFAILLWVLLGVFIITAFTDEALTLGIMVLDLAILSIAIVNIMAIAFSRIKLGILLKIIRKTFVGEILFGLITLIFVFSLLFYTMEEGFATYGDALWYSFAVVTTIGFGDFFAKGLIGRLLTVILGIYGIIVVAALTSVIVNFYQESTKHSDVDTQNKPVTLDEIAREAEKDMDAKTDDQPKKGENS